MKDLNLICEKFIIEKPIYYTMFSYFESKRT